MLYFINLITLNFFGNYTINTQVCYGQLNKDLTTPTNARKWGTNKNQKQRGEMDTFRKEI